MNYATDLLDGVTIDDVREQLNKTPQMFDTFLKDVVPIFKPVQGTNKIRVLPPVDFRSIYPGEEFNGKLGLKVFVHSYVTPARDSYLCNKLMKGENCPFCEAFLKYQQVDYDRAKKYRPAPRILMWLVDLNEDNNPVVKLWPAPPTVVSEILDIAYDDDAQVFAPLLDKDAGPIVRFSMTKEGDFNKYSGFKLLKPYSVTDSMLQQIVPYDKLLKFYEYDYMKERLSYVPEPPEIPTEEDIPDISNEETGAITEDIDEEQLPF